VAFGVRHQGDREMELRELHRRHDRLAGEFPCACENHGRILYFDVEGWGQLGPSAEEQRRAFANGWPTVFSRYTNAAGTIEN
jgi:hypothetical protein